MEKFKKIICICLLIISSLHASFGQKTEASKLKIVETNEDSISISWENVPKAKHIIIAKKGSPVTAKPIDGVDYFASNIFSLGNELADNEFIVYEGDDNKMSLVGLSPNTNYHFTIYEFNGTNYSVEYNKTKYVVGDAKTKKANNEIPQKLKFQNTKQTAKSSNTEDTNKSELKIFGNPVNDLLKFEFITNDNFPIEAKLFDPFGKELFSQQYMPNIKNEIDFNQFTPGIYILKVCNGEKFKIVKVLKNN
jgi:hypothetical protein